MKLNKLAVLGSIGVMGLFATSCNSGDAGNSVLGKWRYADWKLSGEAVNLAEFGNPVITFNGDSTFLVQTGNQKNQQKWYVKNDTLVMLYTDGNKQLYKLNQPSADTTRLKSISGAFDSELLLVRIND